MLLNWIPLTVFSPTPLSSARLPLHHMVLFYGWDSKPFRNRFWTQCMLHLSLAMLSEYQKVRQHEVRGCGCGCDCAAVSAAAAARWCSFSICICVIALFRTRTGVHFARCYHGGEPTPRNIIRRWRISGSEKLRVQFSRLLIASVVLLVHPSTEYRAFLSTHAIYTNEDTNV